MRNVVPNFVVIDSVHGKFIVNRHCAFQAEALIKTGATHIEAELNNILAVVGSLPLGAVVIDAGANIGFVSVPMANVLREKGGVVWSFEVQRMLYNALCGSVALNDLDNLYVFNQGLGKISGFVEVPTTIYSRPADFGTLSLVEQPIDAGKQSFCSVPMARIDDLDLGRLDFLKIDVEGMELDVLQGGIDSIDKYRPWCWVEYWKSDTLALSSFFSARNYTVYKMDSLNILCAPVEKLSTSGLKIDAPLFG